MATSSLPANFALWFSPNKCVGVPQNDPSGFLKLDVPIISDLRAKFAVEPTRHDPSLVNIRSCYNNKYLVAREQQVGGDWVAASADQPQNDTLFKAVFSGSSPSGKPIVKLTYVSKNMGVKVQNEGLILTYEPSQFAQFQAFDVDKLVILPDYGVFRSEQLRNHRLFPSSLSGHNYHRFEPGTPNNYNLVAHQTFPTDVLNYRIKNLHFGMFWRASPNWIWADGEEQDYYNNDTVFSFEKLDENENVYAVRNLGNNNYCGGHTEGEIKDCLSAYYPTKRAETRLIFEGGPAAN